MGSTRKKALKLKKEIEKHISDKIPETKFYKRYRDFVLDWYNFSFEESLLVSGGYGIGKSRTIKQILDSEGIPYRVFQDRFYTLKQVQEVLNIILNLDEDTLIIFDDCKLTKWMEYALLHLLNKNYPILIIANSFQEIEKLEKIIGRIRRLELFIEKEDLELLKSHLSSIYKKISYDKYIILSIRDLVNASLRELLGYSGSLTIEEIMRNVDLRKKKKMMLKEIIKMLRDRGFKVDTEIIIEIGIKLLGYSESTLRKNLARYLL